MWASAGTEQPWQQIVTSPMRRCREFAEQLAGRSGLPVRIDDRLKEIGFGSWEGRTRAQIQATNRQEYDNFYRDPVGCRPAGAEPLDAFISRVLAAYESALADAAGRHTLIVAHAGVLRAVVAHVLRAPPASLYRINVTYAGTVRVRHGEYGAELESLNGVLE
jgi:probable phosphoglycerate mutase